jgi:hypothetical protein
MKKWRPLSHGAAVDRDKRFLRSEPSSARHVRTCSRLRVRMPGGTVSLPGTVRRAVQPSISDPVLTRRMGAIVNAPRSLICAYQRRKTKDKESMRPATRAESIRSDEIREALAAAANQFSHPPGKCRKGKNMNKAD